MTKRSPIRMDKAAMALQWAIYSFMPESKALSSKANNLALELGFHLSSNILLPLAAELGLKGLKQKETSVHCYKRTHDLLCLFWSLSDVTQGKLSIRFQTYMDDDEKMHHKESSMESFLKKHRLDFVEWRYLDGDLDKLASSRIEFHYIICAILDEIYSDEA